MVQHIVSRSYIPAGKCCVYSTADNSLLRTESIPLKCVGIPLESFDDIECARQRAQIWLTRCRASEYMRDLMYGHLKGLMWSVQEVGAPFGMKCVIQNEIAIYYSVVYLDGTTTSEYIQYAAIFEEPLASTG